MKKRVFLLVFLIVLLVVSSAMVASSFKVKANKENVVAGRLEGRWPPQIPLTKRLLGERYQPGPATSSSYISFSAEPSVVQKIPAKYEKFLKDKTIYMAGIMTRWGKDYPFILIELFGNPHIVYFRERQGDPMGDAESFNVMLAPAKGRANDLLFIGGDFNNQPFAAYERKQRTNATASLQAKPFLDFLESLKTSNLELFKTVYSERMKAGFEKQGWDKVFRGYQNECKTEFGDFELTDFDLFFEAEDHPDVLKIEFKGKQLGSLQLVKENNLWKINER